MKVTLTLNLKKPKVRKKTVNGKLFLITNVVMIVPGVLKGSGDEPLYYPAAECQKSVDSWNGMDAVVYHPVLNGQPISARTPEINESSAVGRVWNAKFTKGKLTAEVWFDAGKLETVDPDLYANVLAGEPINVSTGLFLDTEEAPEGSEDHKGRPYSLIATNFRPDHLAILPDQIGACILPGQEIQGRITKASEARYSGEAVRIRTGLGVVLSVTPNHPILTVRGFVPAGEITEGENLLHYVGENESGPTDDHEEYAPALSENVFQTLAGLSSAKKLLVRTASPLDFHGDARFFQGDVKIVFPQGELGRNSVSDSSKRFIKGGFSGGGNSQLSLSRGSPTLKSADGVCPTDVGGICDGREPLAFVGTEVGVHQSGSLGLATHDSLGTEPVVDGVNTGTCLGGYGGYGYAVDIEANSPVDQFVGEPFAGDSLLSGSCIFGPAAELNIRLPKSESDRADMESKLFGKLLDAFPGKVLPDQVINIDRFFHDGPVYDFESATGYIVANKLIVSNCSLEDGCGLNVNSKSWEPIPELVVNSGRPKPRNKLTANGEYAKSYEDRRMELSKQMEERFGYGAYMTDMYDDSIVFSFGGKMWKLPYSEEDDHCVLSEDEPMKVKRVTYYEPTTNRGGANVALTKKQRAEIINHLTANCECWGGEGDAEILANMTDEKLESLKEISVKEAQIITVANAAVKGFKDPESGKAYRVNPETGKFEGIKEPKNKTQVSNADDDYEPEEEEEETPAPKKAAKKKETTTNSKPRTRDEWFRLAPPEVQKLQQTAEAVVEREKAKIVAQLTANMNPADRDAHRERLMKRDLDDLAADLEMMPKAPPPEELPEVKVNKARKKAPQEQRPDMLMLPSIDWSNNGKGTAKSPAPVNNDADEYEPAGNDEQDEEDWFQNAPARVKQQILNAQAVEDRERRRLIQELVDNVKDPEAAEALSKTLENKSLSALREFQLVQQAGGGKKDARRDNYWAPQPAANNRSTVVPDSELLSLPKIDWNQPVATNGRAK